MKGNVFIGWNATPDLARKVKEELQKSGYNGIVGGKDSGTLEHGVGATVVSQIKNCSSAIMLFSARETSYVCEQGHTVTQLTLSGNMLYELGYLNGSKMLNRVLAVYIDGASELSPSDLRGSWDYTIKSTKNENGEECLKSLDEMAQEIAKVFVAEQKDSIVENKMDMLTDISALRTVISNHITNPVLYETELATVVLIFSQSAYMLDDIANSRDLLNELQHNVHNKECLLAIKSSFAYFDACQSITNEGYDKMVIKDRDYYSLQYVFEELVEEAETITDDDFKAMFLMIVYDYLTFINMMHYNAYDPDELDQETLKYREDCALKTIENSEACRAFNPIRNSQFCLLNESYTYRNLALFYRSVNRHDEANEYFEKSLAARKELYSYFRIRNLNKNIFDQINMEYHLSLIDNIFDVCEEERFKRCRELKRYVNDVSEQTYNREYLIKKIKKVLDQTSADKK